MSSPKILITGGGLLGSAVARAASEFAGSVFVADARRMSMEGMGYNTVELDVCDVRQVVAVFDQVKPSIVVHTAGILGVTAERSPRWTTHVNVIGALTVLEAAAAAGVNQVIVSSSLAVYDWQRATGLISEESPKDQTSVYGLSKFMLEEVLDLAPPDLTEVVVLRFAGLYQWPGRKSGHSKLAALVSQTFQRAESGVVRVPKSLVDRELLNVEDAAEVVRRVILSSTPGLSTYNVPGFVHSVSDIEEALLAVSPESHVDGGSLTDVRPQAVLDKRRLVARIGDFTPRSLRDVVRASDMSTGSR